MFYFPVLYAFFTEALCKLKCVAGSTKKGKKNLQIPGSEIISALESFIDQVGTINKAENKLVFLLVPLH